MVIDTGLLRLAFPLLAFDLAIRLDERQIGLLHDLPAMPAIVLDVLLLDRVPRRRRCVP